MRRAEVDEIINDINEAFIDVGTIDNKPNIGWLARKLDQRDSLYKQDSNPQYNNAVGLQGLVLGGTLKSELDNIGYDYRKVSKIYIAGNQFTKNSVTPVEADRIIHNDIKYNVLRIIPTSIANTDLMYRVYIQEAPFITQEEEYREKLDPTFEPDATQAEEETDTTGVSIYEYSDYPAEIKSEYSDDNYEIVLDVNDKIKLELNETTEVIVTLSAGVWTKDEIRDDMQLLFDSAFGAGQVLVSIDAENKIVWNTERKGSTAFLELKVVAGSCYLSFGFKIGKYQGSKNLDYEADPYYNNDGDPLYGNV
jgi:hypothetical protein